MTAAAKRPQRDGPTLWLARADLQTLVDVLWQEGYRVIGPTVAQAAIVYDEIRSVDDLPRGWTDEQSGGSYRLKRRDDEAYFGYVVGPHSWKQYLFPPRATVAVADRRADGWHMSGVERDEPAFAFLGARACELAALAVQDRTFLGDDYVDPIYRARRERAFIVAVNCTQAASTCFCTSMDTGPRCTGGFDLAMTELPDGFTLEVGSERGARIAAQLPNTAAAKDTLARADSARQQAVEQISKHLDTTDIRDLLLNNLEHERWNEVATRCLSCTNCTMVCPTCFCNSVKDVADLQGDHVERVREWDTCFNWDFSYMNGAVVRDQIRSRYRQWLTHKLASWIDQFDVSGCVGCGRCITWCPVGIDLTEEVAAIRETAP
ncbi:MAG: sulfite reductase subunit A [Planctomycetota bacterium]|nr:MAG: sulfite reductase subunit A [Planctomycetota bacterium]